MLKTLDTLLKIISKILSLCFIPPTPNSVSTHEYRNLFSNIYFKLPVTHPNSYSPLPFNFVSFKANTSIFLDQNILPVSSLLPTIVLHPHIFSAPINTSFYKDLGSLTSCSPFPESAPWRHYLRNSQGYYTKTVGYRVVTSLRLYRRRGFRVHHSETDFTGWQVLYLYNSGLWGQHIPMPLMQGISLTDW